MLSIIICIIILFIAKKIPTNEQLNTLPSLFQNVETWKTSIVELMIFNNMNSVISFSLFCH